MTRPGWFAPWRWSVQLPCATCLAPRKCALAPPTQLARNAPMSYLIWLTPELIEKVASKTFDSFNL